MQKYTKRVPLLTEKETIRVLKLKKEGISYRILAKMFDVSTGTIRWITDKENRKKAQQKYYTLNKKRIDATNKRYSKLRFKQDPEFRKRCRQSVKVWYTKRKQRMLEDSEYREKVQTARRAANIRKAIKRSKK